MLFWIVTDRGTAFTSKTFIEYCKSNAIQHILNAVRTPRANGQIERANQVVLMHLRTTTEKSTDWDKKLRNLQFTINYHINKTLKCSPNDVIFTYKLRDVL